jgi:cation transport ATPase
VVVLKGTAVVNEATLTGESIPQMKEALVSTSHIKFDVFIFCCVLFLSAVAFDARDAGNAEKHNAPPLITPSDTPLFFLSDD